jgi:predicted acylesterase/phospholipase RssA
LRIIDFLIKGALELTKRFKSALLALLISVTLVQSGQSRRPKVGIALSGGGALGLAHLGVLKKIDSLNIPIDYIAGTSMGGLVGGLYACGYSAKEIESIVRDLDWDRVFRDRPPRKYLPYFVKKDIHKFQFNINMQKYQPEMPGVINGQKIELLLSRLVYDYSDVKDFDNLPIPFRCVSVDLVTGREVIHRKGNLSTAMRATMSVPSIFVPVKMGDSLLIDGGLLNNVPVDVVREMGADVIIASTVRNPKKTVEELNNPLKIIDHSFNIVRNKAVAKQTDSSDLLINTVIEEYKPYNFVKEKTKGIIARGDQVADKYTGQIIQLKEKYNLNKLTESELENENYLLGEIQLNGNLSIPDSSIFDIINISRGEILTPEIISTLENQLEKTGWFDSIDCKLKLITGNIARLQVFVRESKPPYIFSIRIKGNEQLSFGFIYRMLGIKPGDKLILDNLESRIYYLYGLEYFRKITYSIKNRGFRKVALIINVEESSFQKLRLGFRYDNNYGFVANLSGLQNNFLFPGLKATDEIHFIGLLRLKTKIYYPSRTFSQPFYPFIYLDYINIPRNIYDHYGSKFAEYDQRSLQFGGGAGFVLNNSLNTEISGNREYINIKPEIQLPDTIYYPSWKTTLDKINLTINYDGLDNSINPESGFSIEGGLEYCDYFEIFRSNQNYYKFDLKGDFYYTPIDFLTINHGFYFFNSSSGMPIYKGEFIGGPESFMGIKYNQFLVRKFSFIKTALEFHFPEKISARLIGNYALHCDHYRLFLTNKYNYEQLAAKFGYGLALKKESRLGPLELIFARGPKGFSDDQQFQSVFYIKAGYKF